MIIKCEKQIELKSGLMVYPYKVDFDTLEIDPLFVFAADAYEAVDIAKYIAWRDYDYHVGSCNISVNRITLYDQYLVEFEGVARIDKKDSDLA